ncbi:recombinase family protein [Nocardioides marmoribigeumensis]|uniref:DNA invertase Pin-like site-specific DNA recombinase n=1 Tax=Nocardioides marmoribigeumensis TaxID=433649 RepID=A0ABU2C086_9ACTN|nr:recombinase family protein [Nocardioides marmoribigeumensis]MDR7364071.1 DNA invertase Pin-like site-specific DNA recombinase [Nocardioides marmoribigeumensis]
MTESSQRRAALYLRQSVTRKGDKDTVSLAVQEDRCRKWAESQGMSVVGVWSDPDTSGSKVDPAERPGWRALAEADFDCVVVYRIDRLSRNFNAFWATVRALQDQGRSLASVNEGFSLDSPVGKIVASVLAAVAEMTADDISARVADSRQKVLADGRAPGGTVCYGYRRVRAADGIGYVYVQDAETIGWVKGMVERVRRGDSIHSVRMWLNEAGATPPRLARALRHNADLPDGREPVETEGLPTTWESWSSVERILRHPFLYGAVPSNPGNVGSKRRGEGVMTDAVGRVVIHEHLAVMSRGDWTAMVAGLDAADKPQNRPRAARKQTSGLLSGLVVCACEGLDGGQRMWRNFINGRPGYNCPKCRMSISNFEDVVVEEFLRGWGDTARMHRVETADAGGAEDAADLALDIRALQAQQLDADDAEYDSLATQIKALRRQREAALARRPVLRWEWVATGQTYREAWEAAEGDEAAQRRVLDDVLSRVTVLKGRPGRRTREQVRARLLFDWKPDESWVAEPA